MRLPETRAQLERDCDFPLDHDTLVETVGDVELEAPDGEDRPIADVLSRSEQGVYDSADEAYRALVRNVGDAYVGRKEYDDRAGAIDRHDERSF